MARYTNDITPGGPADQVMGSIESYLTGEGFSQTQHGGEQVWKKGLGILTGPQFLKVEQQGEQIHVEAWIKFALFPGVFIGEMGTDGVFAVIPKKMLKKKVDAIEAMAQKVE